MLNTLHLLSDIAMPTPEFADFQELFLRKKTACVSYQNVLQSVSIWQFDTWMNLFAAQKYYQFCDLGKIFLKIDVSSSCEVQIWSCNTNYIFGPQRQLLLSKQISAGENTIELPDVTKAEGIYFSLLFPQESSMCLTHCGWYTDKASNFCDRVALICCSFKREGYVYKNIEKIKKYFCNDKDFSSHAHFYVIDNGKTLDLSKNTDNITIIYNNNSGGAGGFTRGIIEAMDAPDSFDRLILFDDDVEIFPESLKRTWLLANYLKKEFRNAFIDGAMLRNEHKNMFFENLAVRNGILATAYLPHDLDLNKTDQILLTNHIPQELFVQDAVNKTDGAWFFCSFPLSLVKEKKLPLPLFIRGDDLEWGWRNQGTPHIAMNGICIWHASFDFRVGIITECYWMIKNTFFIAGFYYPQNQKRWITEMMEYYNVLLATHNYPGLKLLIAALQDIAKGAAFFETNPEKLLNRLGAIAREIPSQDIVHEDEILRMTLPPLPPPRSIIQKICNKIKRKIFYNKLMKRLVRYYFQHWNVPSLFYRGIAEIAPPFILAVNISSLMLKKEVKIINPVTRKYQHFIYDAAQEKALKKEFFKALDHINKNYNKLQEDFAQAYPKLTSREFWNVYLGIKK